LKEQDFVVRDISWALCCCLSNHQILRRDFKCIKS